MRYRTRVNKLYSNIFSGELFNTPYFVFYYNDCYYVYKTIYDTKKHFKTLAEAKTYIEDITFNALILLIDFHEKND